MGKSLIVKISRQSLKGLLQGQADGTWHIVLIILDFWLKFKALVIVLVDPTRIYIQFSNRYNVIQHPVIIPSNNVLSKQEKFREISAEFLVIYSIP